MTGQPVVLVTDFTWQSTEVEEAVLAEVGARLLIAERGDEDELIALVPEADAILTCFATVGPEVVRAGGRLQVIGRYGAGTDNIAVDEATRHGIPVTNVPAYCVDEVAEHVLAMIFCLVRGLHRYDRAVREGDWSLTTGLPTRRIVGSMLGIVGYGNIGSRLAERARALGLRVIVHDPRADAEAMRQAGVEPVSLDELAARSDFVSIHVPLTERTRGMIDSSFLAAMKPTAYLINCARGGIVDQSALLCALADAEIAGAGVDVFEPERLPADHPLLAQDTLLATPHSAFYSEEAVRDLARLAAENVAEVLRGDAPAEIVNPEVLEHPRSRHLSSGRVAS